MKLTQSDFARDKPLETTRTAGQAAHSRPYENKTYAQDPSNPVTEINRARGYSNKPNPIKHWRRQLIPRAGTGSSTRAARIPYDLPGGVPTVPIAPSSNHPVPLCDVVKGYNNQAPNLFIQNPHKPDLYFYKPWACRGGNRVYFSGDGYPGTSRCIGCNPEANLIRPTAGMNTKRINPIAKTAQHDTQHGHSTPQHNAGCAPRDVGPIQSFTTTPYSFDTRAYLRSKSKSYETQLSGRRDKSIDYARQTSNCCTVAVPPHPDPAKSSGTRISLYATHLNSNIGSDNKQYRTSCCPITVKPNNPQFFQQGAVSSSSRMERLKLNTIRSSKKTSASTTAWAQQADNAGVYRQNGQGPYFIKNKAHVCRPALDYALLDGRLAFPGRRRFCALGKTTH